MSFLWSLSQNTFFRRYLVRRLIPTVLWLYLCVVIAIVNLFFKYNLNTTIPININSNEQVVCNFECIMCLDKFLPYDWGKGTAIKWPIPRGFPHYIVFSDQSICSYPPWHCFLQVCINISYLFFPSRLSSNVGVKPFYLPIRFGSTGEVIGQYLTKCKQLRLFPLKCYFYHWYHSHSCVW